MTPMKGFSYNIVKIKGHMDNYFDCFDSLIQLFIVKDLKDQVVHLNQY